MLLYFINIAAMKNIKILSLDHQYTSNIESNVINEKFVSFVNYFLRLSHEFSGKSGHLYKWLPPEILVLDFESGFSKENIEQILKMIENQKVDIIGFSVYVWNKENFVKLGTEIKKRFPDIIIIGGGPELDAHKNQDFFQANPFYDYIVYGDGEIGFTSLLDHLAGIPEPMHNVVTKDGTVYPMQVFSNKEILTLSPYLTYKEEIKSVIKKLKQDCTIVFKNNYKIVGVWETTKGCPYSCSFCDWSSGLHNKVRFWNNKEAVINQTSRPNYELELDFFTELELDMIMWSNPNVGLSPSDESIVDYWCNLANKNLKTPKSFILQLAKLKKEKTHNLFRKLLKAGIEENLKFDVQDLDSLVLKNIDRPEIPWSDHKEMIRKLTEEFPLAAESNRAKINFIWGLPGQTLSHFDYNLSECISLGFKPNFYLFEWLPNAPVSDPAYSQQFELNIEKIFVNYSAIPPFIKKITPQVYHRYFVKTNLITSSYSMTKKQWYTGVVKFDLLKQFYLEGIVRKDLIAAFLNYFYLYDSIVDQLYELFLEHQIIGLQDNMFNFSAYDDVNKQIKEISLHILSLCN